MMQEGKRKTKRHKRWIAVLSAVFAFTVVVLAVLQLGCVYTERTWDYWQPNYDKVDIETLLTKERLSIEDYELLYRQTGLTKIAVDDMRVSEFGKAQILGIQNSFFSKYPIKSRLFSVFTHMDEIEGFTQLCPLKDGDIIVSAATRVSWWRYGHAAIVVDGEAGTIAEAISPGTKSKLSSAFTFTNLANFIILRPKADEALKKEIAAYVKAEMIGIPYRLTTGILTKKYQEELTASQCAHFIWYAYKKFGIDLDSTGGRVVKPQDIALSNHVEVVQVYGFDLDKLWG